MLGHDNTFFGLNSTNNGNIVCFRCKSFRGIRTLASHGGGEYRGLHSGDDVLGRYTGLGSTKFTVDSNCLEKILTTYIQPVDFDVPNPLVNSGYP